MEILKILKNHENDIKRQYGVKKIGIFGSYVRGENTEDSDIDILVEFDEPTYQNFMDLIDFLENLFSRKIDLVTSNSLSPYIRPVVEKEVVWCE
jgi:predicted nucleotidyltransferase